MTVEGSYQCFGRIQGEHPIFIPVESGLVETLAEKAHILTIHGGVTLTMAKIRSEYCITSLGELLKKTINVISARDITLAIIQNHQRYCYQ